MSVFVVKELPPETPAMKPPLPSLKPTWTIACKEGETLEVAFDPASETWRGKLTIPGSVMFATGQEDLPALLCALANLTEHMRQPALGQ